MAAQTALTLTGKRPAAATATDRRSQDDDTPLTVGPLRELLADAERRRFMPGGLPNRLAVMLIKAIDDRIGNRRIGEYAA